MNVIFRTNLDQYRQVEWPSIDYKPAIGETVSVHPRSKNWCNNLRIPTQLEIVGVSHHSNGCYVELWYSSIDIKRAEMSNTMKDLMGQ